MDQTIYKIALVTHIVGITMMAGTTFIDFVFFRQFWKVFPQDKTRSIILEDTLGKLQRFLGIGMLIIIASGVAMMAYLHEVWGAQIWFRVKMGLLLFIIVNGLAIRRRLGKKVKKMLTDELSGDALNMPLSKIKSNITLSHLFQLLLFITIFVLSVFKFN